MNQAERNIFFGLKQLLVILWREFTVVWRFIRLRFLEHMNSPLWRSIKKNDKSRQTVLTPQNENSRKPQNDATAKTKAPQTEDITPVSDHAAPQKQESAVEKLLDKFGAKVNAREGRKKMAVKKSPKPHVTGEEQLEFQFQDNEEDKQPDEIPEILPEPNEPYQLPPLSLFIQEESKPEIDNEEIRENAEKMQNCLDSFNVDADIGMAVRGPRVTLFQVCVAKGVRVSILSTYAKDLSMALSARSIRIMTPVPGHDYAGVEVPNKHADRVLCGNLLNAPAWQNTKAVLPLMMGKNIEGEDVILDLARAPHLLVAGATGSGKSVCLNNFIVSLVTRFPPDDLKLVLVDPKVVEMNTYNTLPHLVVPVINDVQLVVIALRWLIFEMGRRYKLLAKVQVRNLEDFNKRKLPAEPMTDDDGNPIPDKLPFLVLIIDELADIMITNKNDVETCLARLAQMSRAVGIHTIVATQRPSVDVITGVIKANFPTRIAFQTSSQIDSRTIIDGKGAESLLGKGDMLYKPPTASAMQRIQGAMVTDQEIEALVNFCASQRPAPKSFDTIKVVAENTDVKEDEEDNVTNEPDSDAADSLVHAAMEVVINDKKASVSYIQRRLKVGYNKAATLMEILEKKGIVGPQIGSLKREILVDSMEEAVNNDNY